MGTKLQRVHDVLERNKIFFETVAASLLSAMAIILAIVQTWVATRQTTLMALQTRVAEAQVLPQFEILGFAGNDGDATWVVSNHGARVQELQMDVGCILTIVPGSDTTRRLRLELSQGDCVDSWNATEGPTDKDGVLGRLHGSHKTTEINAFEERIGSFIGANPRERPPVRVELLVALRYRDLLGRDRQAYYLTSTFHGTRALSDAEGATLMTRWRHATGRDLSTLTSEQITSLLRSPH